MGEAQPEPPYLLRYRDRVAGRQPDQTRLPFSLRSSTAPDGAAGPDTARALRQATSDPEMPVPSNLVDLHLVRHGETQSYQADAGLTPRGTWQCRRFGHTLSAEVRDGERVHLLCAPTARATRTAEQVRLGLVEGLAGRGREVTVVGPEPAVEFRNFQLWTPAGLMDPTSAAGAYRWGTTGLEPGRPAWQLELSRFWRLQAGGGDPIEYWMTSPLLTFEPPVAVVRRFWAGAVRLVSGGDGRTRFVCCTHSGPMRAFATWALGHDAGEPLNTEEVRVRFRPDLSAALVTYRGRAQEIGAAAVPDGTAWWDPAAGGPT
ncbi:MAG TPA: histidine phosphatase family protein [Candidatus Dormibacteraeota bacterium]|jgi:broad specificity phosphatase PhoE